MSADSLRKCQLFVYKGQLFVWGPKNKIRHFKKVLRSQQQIGDFEEFAWGRPAIKSELIPSCFLESIPDKDPFRDGWMMARDN